MRRYRRKIGRRFSASLLLDKVLCKIRVPLLIDELQSIVRKVFLLLDEVNFAIAAGPYLFDNIIVQSWVITFKEIRIFDELSIVNMCRKWILFLLLSPAHPWVILRLKVVVQHFKDLSWVFLNLLGSKV